MSTAISTIITDLKTFFQKIFVSNDSYTVFDDLPGGTQREYTTKLQAKGTITGVWLQFYWTIALLSYVITVDGSPVFKNMANSQTPLALHNATVSFVTNKQFDQGMTLSVLATNSDVDLHRVRVVVSIQYG
jgi:hypothetical protein